MKKNVGLWKFILFFQNLIKNNMVQDIDLTNNKLIYLL